ncbi:type II toxin-antitoxin system VapC family toxin [Pseudomonas fluorescens]|uniref:type II toxin-antitoxin system VapC family toxin n=1 Tax=Pseudomonas fluorescens TaxID=294 RepID=UPI000935A19F|nr:type II toxin-antitoxin system VapC family toxin [Pseudomonas fluorescens]
MRLLLDTHILLWALNDDSKLSGNARKLIENAAEIYVRDLEYHHKDPFDRLIIATAMTEPMKLLTADPEVAQYTSLAILV